MKTTVIAVVAIALLLFGAAFVAVDGTVAPTKETPTIVYSEASFDGNDDPPLGDCCAGGGGGQPLT